MVADMAHGKDKQDLKNLPMSSHVPYGCWDTGYAHKSSVHVHWTSVAHSDTGSPSEGGLTAFACLWMRPGGRLCCCCMMSQNV